MAHAIINLPLGGISVDSLRGTNTNMIQPIIFNKYINKIGVEFEGCFNDDFLSACRDIEDESLIKDVKGDGSVDTVKACERHMTTREVTTQPLKAKGLTEVLTMFSSAQDEGSYSINNTVGLHYHVSLNKSYYGYIDNQEFYDEYVEMFKKCIDSKIFKERATRNYCKVKHGADHFKLCSRDRYAMINYCYERHHTVEFRGYGGTYGTIQELSFLIQETINLIGKFIEKKDKLKSALCHKIELTSEDRAPQNVNCELQQQRLKKVNIDITDMDKQFAKLIPTIANFDDTSKIINLEIDLSV